MASRLVMSGDISDWLHELAADEPARARSAGAALVEVLAVAELATAPGVTSLAEPDSDPIDGRAVLDACYQQLLDKMQQLRQEAALAATARGSIDEAMAALADATDYGDVTDRLARLKEHRQAARRRETEAADRCARLQLELDDFRVRREVAKAGYTAALGALKVRRALTETTPGELAKAETAVTEAKASLDAAGRAARALLSQPDGRAGPADGLLELDLGGHADDQIRLLLAEEPPGTALLLAVLHGEAAIASHRQQAIELASDLLDDLRAGAPGGGGGDPHAEFGDAAEFLAAFFPGDAGEIEREAADLGSRLTLRQLREQLGLEPDAVARHMRVSLARLQTIEQTSLADLAPGQLASYVAALGGDLRVTAVIGTDHFNLR